MDIAHQLASTAVIHELLGDEVIIANLDTGVYFSLRGSGVIIWQMLLQNYSIFHITERLAKHYSLLFESLQQTVLQFVNQLIEEGILKAIPQENLLSEQCDLIFPEVYQDPLFEKYDDMKNLLMLDPIHEVDEQGWPNKI